MKRLYLVRHAKSDWQHSSTDLERPLKKSGIKRANQHAHWWSGIEDCPKHWFTSPAVRTQQTAQIFSQHWNPKPTIRPIEDLYTFSPTKLIQEIKKLPDEINEAVVFCHNEAITYASIELGNKSIENVTTAGIVCIEFEQNFWEEVNLGITKWIHLTKK